ncbi:unnamed protein product, partial [Rodentolepis nana]|uniref:DUF4178 domain-containing protein n=1 Tax=Rodentolepis nana TaxID=102285 RepID=A0A0R3TMQ1_RODNA
IDNIILSPRLKTSYFRCNSFLTFHFLTLEAIFQRNYTIEYQGKRQTLGENIGGLIELATEGQGGFFHMIARGYTFSNGLNTRVEWTEDGERKYHENLHSQEGELKLYPDIEELSNWTVSANRIVTEDVYPDVKDNETVIYRWILPNQNPTDVLVDLFRIIGEYSQ